MIIMKRELQIIGAKVVGVNLVKVVCIPYTTPEVREKRLSLLDLALKGDTGIKDIVREAKDVQEEKTIFFVSLDEWRKFFKNRLLSRIVMNINVEQFMEE